MNRSFLQLVLFWVASCVRCGGEVVPGDDFNANTRIAIGVLQQEYNSGGLWDTTGWWNAANCVQALENSVVLNNGGACVGAISNTFSLNCGANFLNDYYDDEGWWAEAWIRAYDLTGELRYLEMAKTIFNDMTNGWSSTCGGGLWWDKYQTYKNAIPNELFLLVAVRLHQRTPGDRGQGSYYYWATNEWAWFKASGMLNGQSLVNDGLTAECLNNGRTTWTYNQGVLLGGLTDLYKVTGATNYLNEAEAIADAVLTHLVSPSGVLREPCEVFSRCHGRDVPQFKGIFIRNLAYLYDVDHKPAYLSFLITNAHSVWFNDRNGANQLGLKWTGAFDSADAARHSSALMALGAVASPSTPLLSFARGVGDVTFNHSCGVAAGSLAWACSPANSPQPGYMQYGPYLASLAPGNHTAHFRMAVDSPGTSSSNLVRLEVARNRTVLASRDVPWSSFAGAGDFRDFAVPFTNSNPGAALEFRVYWKAVPGAPTVTVGDLCIDGGLSWTGANLAHDIGRLDGHNNWEADPVRDTSSGYLIKGPGTAELGTGKYRASFELTVDNFNWDNATVATLSVVDTVSGQVLVSRDIARREFRNALYQTFDLSFEAKNPGRYDFRTYWHYAPTAPRLTERSVVVTAAKPVTFSQLP